MCNKKDAAEDRGPGLVHATVLAKVGGREAFVCKLAIRGGRWELLSCASRVSRQRSIRLKLPIHLTCGGQKGEHITGSSEVGNRVVFCRVTAI